MNDLRYMEDCEDIERQRMAHAVRLVVEERRRAWELRAGSSDQHYLLDRSLTFARGVAKALDVDFEEVIRGVQAMEKNR